MAYFNFKNEQTPINDTNLNIMQKELMELVFPIGSRYITQDADTNPNTILGFGTWERFKGLVALGVDEEDEDLNEIGKKVGEKNVTLTLAQIPSHDHGVFGAIIGGKNANSENFRELAEKASNNSEMASDKTGGGQPHNNMQPSEVVGYMWIRRA